MLNRFNTLISSFFKSEPAGGIVLMLAAILAILCANSFLQPYYDLWLDTTVQLRIGTLDINKPLLLWINDGLMALFFFLIGLELKRELLEGELADIRNVLLPAIGAVGGMLVPALIYVYINWGNPDTLNGWAIPAATDIAFALGVLALLGSQVPTSVKVFLTSIAVFDDIGAILIIAFFYTSKISLVALGFVVLCVLVLYIFNRFNLVSKSPYVLMGVIMWTAMLKSGVHATLAGVLLAFFVPLENKTNPSESPLKILEHDLHHLVAFFVLPLFAFANAGLDLRNMSIEQMVHGVPIGIALGLFLGKQIGIFGFCWIFTKLKIAKLPAGMNWASLYGTACLCGIGFTMSLFIGSLAFEESGINRMFDERLGIIIGSLASGLLGFFLLKSVFRINRKEQ